MVLLATSAASAQSGADSARASLIAQAVAAREANDHARALDLSQRAGEIRMTPSLRRFIAEEQQTLRQFPSALGNADLCVQEARATGRPQDLEHGTVCEAIARELRAHVGQVVVRVPDGTPPSTRVLVGGQELPRPLWGIATPVMPGATTIEAEGPDGRRFTSTVNITAGATEEVTVTLAAPQGAVAATEASTSTGSSTATASTTTAPAASSASPGLMEHIGPAPFVVLGVGALALGLSPVFYAVSRSELDSAARWCGGTLGQCGARTADDPDRMQAERDYARAERWTTAANIAWVAGGITLAAGATWLLVKALGHRPEEARTTVMIRPSADGVVFGLGGTL